MSCLYALLNVGKKNFLIKCDSELLSSQLCANNVMTISYKDAQSYELLNNDFPKEGSKVVNLYNDPLYTSKLLANINVDSIDFYINHMCANSIYEFTRETGVLINDYIMSIDESIDMWTTLASVIDHNSVTLSTRIWCKTKCLNDNIKPRLEDLNARIMNILKSSEVNIENLAAECECIKSICKDIINNHKTFLLKQIANIEKKIYKCIRNNDNAHVVLSKFPSKITYWGVREWLSENHTDEVVIPKEKSGDEKIEIKEFNYPTGNNDVIKSVNVPTKYDETNYNMYIPLEKCYYDVYKQRTFVNVIKYLFKCKQTYLIVKLISRVSTSYHCCHYIFDADVINIINSLKGFIFSDIYYTFYMLLSEERIIKDDVCDRRFIIDLNVACKWPYCEYESEWWYLPMPAKKALHSYCPAMIQGKREIVSFDTFKSRLSIFTDGALDDIDYRSCNAYLTGSTMLACLAITPLETNIIGNGFTLREFFEFMYPSYNSLVDDEQENIDNLTDIDIAIICTTLEEFDNYVEKLYQQFLVKYPDAKKTIVIKSFDTDALSGKAPPKYYKYKISSPFMTREIDAYPVFVTIEQLISKFHFPCVKSWYDGHSVKMFISCLSALLSGINSTYNWFSTSEKHVDLVLKYMGRGYTTCLSCIENKDLCESYKYSKWYTSEFDYSDYWDKHIYCPYSKLLNMYSTGIRSGLLKMNVYEHHTQDIYISDWYYKYGPQLRIPYYSEV